MGLVNPGESKKNLFIVTTTDQLSQGTCDGTHITSSGNGAITLEEGLMVGSYESDVFEAMPFTHMVLSWDAETPEGTYVEIQGKVRKTGTEQWTNWLSWGKWSTYAFMEDGTLVLPGSAPLAERDDVIARVGTDELSVKGTQGETVDAFQFRLILHSATDEQGQPVSSPTIFLVASTIKNTLPDREIPSIYAADVDPGLTLLEKDLDVPMYSQYQRDSKIAGSICSPTCMTMIMSYYGVHISPEQCAWGVNDYTVPMFGNWPFNCAYVSAYGFISYVNYGVTESKGDPWLYVKQQIFQGKPVVVSVKYRKPDYSGSKYPPVENVPINSTPGHLVLVRGFTRIKENGTEREYVIVNDPAAPTNEEVRRLYPADQFAAAWMNRIVYIVHVDNDHVYEFGPPAVIGARLLSVGGNKNYAKYQLVAGETDIDMSRNNIRSIVLSYNGGRTVPVEVRSGISGNLHWFETGNPSGTYTYTLMSVDKKVYQATLIWE